MGILDNHLNHFTAINIQKEGKVLDRRKASLSCLRDETIEKHTAMADKNENYKLLS